MSPKETICQEKLTQSGWNSLNVFLIAWLISLHINVCLLQLPKNHYRRGNTDTHIQKWCVDVRLAAISHPVTPPDFKLENSQFTELRRNSKLSLGNVALVLFALARRWAWLLNVACLKPEQQAKKRREEREEGEKETSKLTVCYGIYLEKTMWFKFNSSGTQYQISKYYMFSQLLFQCFPDWTKILVKSDRYFRIPLITRINGCVKHFSKYCWWHIY